MNRINLVLVFAIAIAASGCASVTNDAAQPIKLETVSPSGTFLAGFECSLSNEHGSVKVQSGSTAHVRRSSQDLSIVCKDVTGREATARAVSRANAGMAGNMIVGGAIGAIIDHSTGAAYSYPSWMQLELGKSLVFDRINELHGSPVVAYGGPIAPIGWSASENRAEFYSEEPSFREAVSCVPLGTREGDVVRSVGDGDVRVIRIHSANTHCTSTNAGATTTTATVAARSLASRASVPSSAPAGYSESIECVPVGTRNGDFVELPVHGRVRVSRVHPVNSHCGMIGTSSRNQITATVFVPSSGVQPQRP